MYHLEMFNSYYLYTDEYNNPIKYPCDVYAMCMFFSELIPPIVYTKRKKPLLMHYYRNYSDLNLVPHENFYILGEIQERYSQCGQAGNHTNYFFLIPSFTCAK